MRRRVNQVIWVLAGAVRPLTRIAGGNKPPSHDLVTLNSEIGHCRTRNESSTMPAQVPPSLAKQAVKVLKTP